MSKTKTVLGRTLEEIKEEVSREFLHPYRTWLENSRFSNDDNISVLEDSGAIDEVAQRYAQSQTQELQEQNAELVEMLTMVIDVWGYEYEGSTAYKKVDDLLTKHNHLNKKP